MRRTFFLLVFSLLAFPVSAQGIKADEPCEQAKSTADILACANKQHEQSQDRLGKAFDQQIEALTEEQEAHFREVHKNWILYRDEECNWESGQEPNESLKRIVELKCLENLTQARADILSVVPEAQEKEEFDFITFPRWMNILAEDNPDIFWKHGSRLSADLDCDEKDENVMAGLSIDSVSPVSMSIVIAIAESTETGKPATTLLKRVVHESGENQSFCHGKVSLTENAKAQVPDSVCQNVVTVRHDPCAPFAVYWNGETYEWAIRSDPENQ